MNRIFRKLLKWLQDKCDHKHMRADILQHDWIDEDGKIVAAVRWCPTCGAVQVVQDPLGKPKELELRMPDPCLWMEGWRWADAVKEDR